VLSQLGNFFFIIFTQPIFNLLMLLYHVLGDFGLSIILLTILIRLILFPLTLKQLKSTKAMQAVQPLIADVKKQYPKDQRAQLEATQAIYKEYGVNPAAGCLPLFIQLPVLYGLFNSLNTVLRTPTLQNINNAIYPFLPHFSKLPDPNLTWFTFINHSWYINLGSPDPTHILPVLAALATFIQLRMSQPRTTAATKNAMSQQMQIMQFIMPFVTLFFAWTFPAGLALYWTTTSVFSMVQQYFVTGWGSLFVKPTFLSAGGSSADSSKSKTYTGDSRKETRIVEAGKSSEKGKASSEGPVANKPSNYSNGSNGSGAKSNSSARRRPRPGSASARRRNNMPRSSNPSRS
jgi:YidC/Oxa1 family membrane protein insertase